MSLLSKKVGITVPYLPVAEFATQYRLGPRIIDALDKVGFESAGALLTVSEADLKDAGFQVGQIGELKRALNEWVQAVSKK
jgi:hypothetical protein